MLAGSTSWPTGTAWAKRTALSGRTNHIGRSIRSCLQTARSPSPAASERSPKTSCSARPPPPGRSHKVAPVTAAPRGWPMTAPTPAPGRAGSRLMASIHHLSTRVPWRDLGATALGISPYSYATTRSKLLVHPAGQHRPEARRSLRGGERRCGDRLARQRPAAVPERAINLHVAAGLLGHEDPPLQLQPCPQGHAARHGRDTARLRLRGASLPVAQPRDPSRPRSATPACRRSTRKPRSMRTPF
jgi:hypothetical protein